jgi:hypothetical protein
LYKSFLFIEFEIILRPALLKPLLFIESVAME